VTRREVRIYSTLLGFMTFVPVVFYWRVALLAFTPLAAMMCDNPNVTHAQCLLTVASIYAAPLLTAVSFVVCNALLADGKLETCLSTAIGLCLCSWVCTEPIWGQGLRF